MSKQCELILDPDSNKLTSDNQVSSGEADHRGW